MRGRTVLILLALVVGLVAFIELYEHDLPSSEERIALEKLVLDSAAGEITAVELSWDGKDVRLERELSGVGELEEAGDPAAATWHLVEPMSARADSGLVATLIESLTTLEKNRTLQGSRPEDLGLSPPRLVATLTSKDRQIELSVGSEVPAGNSMIVKVASDGEIVVVEDSIWPELTREPGDWRSRQVTDVGRESVEKVVLVQADQRLVLARRGVEFWLETPVEDRANAERVDSLLADLTAMRVTSFADELAESIFDMGLDPPAAEVELTAGMDGETLHLGWGSAVPDSESQHYARAEQQVFSTAADLQQYFDMSTAEWRSLELTSLETFEIDAVTVVQSGAETLTLGRDGANWTRNEDKISFTAVSDLLYAITGARAAEVLAESKKDLTGLPSSEAALELLLNGEGREQRVSFLPLSDEGARAVVSDREVVLFVGKDEFTEILAKVGQVRAASSVKTDVIEQLPPGVSDLSSDQ